MADAGEASREFEIVAPDATLDEILAPAFMLTFCLAASVPLFFQGSSSWDLGTLRTLIAVIPCLAAIGFWVWRRLGARHCHYRLDPHGIERYEHGYRVWHCAWGNLVARARVRKTVFIFQRPIVIDFWDSSGVALGSLWLLPTHQSKSGIQQRVVLAEVEKRSARFVLVRPPLAERRRGYLRSGLIATVLGAAVLALCIVGAQRLLAIAEEGRWDRTLALMTILPMLPALGALAMGIIELSYLVRDKDQPDGSHELVKKFAERPVLTRVEMRPGVWYRYRDAEKIAKAKALESKFMAWFVFGMTLLAPISLLMPAKPDAPPRNPADLPAILAVIWGMFGLMLWLMAVLNRRVWHRFRIEGDTLHVVTPKGDLAFPARATRRWKGPVRKTYWMAVSDTYGRGLRAYSIDPCFLEECSAREQHVSPRA